ncbi:unnamed protein product, partial [marine sediment metagenome]
AFEDCETILRTTAGLHEDPLVISLLIEIAVNTSALKQMQLVLDQSDPPPACLRSAMTVLEEAGKPGRMTRVLKGERCFAIPGASDLVIDLLTDDVHGIFIGPRPPFYRRPFLRCRAIDETTRFVRYLGLLLEVAELPWCEAKPRIDEIPMPSMDEHLPRVFDISSFETMADSIFAWNVLAARLHLTRTGIALKLYRAATGCYPDGLSDLVPDYLCALPGDPFSGKELVYRPEGGGFILYSLGANLADDAGV